MGDYNLLPHQEKLISEIVHAYTESSMSPKIGVTHSLSGATLHWDEKEVELDFDEDTLWDDLIQIASTGLLDSGAIKQHYREFRITKASLDAVANQFRLQPKRLPIIAEGAENVQTLDFSFLSTTSEREIIERDYEEVKRVVSVRAHKSTIVLCGSIAEAILLVTLRADELKAKAQAVALKIRHSADPLDQWELNELVRVAEAMGILGSDAVTLANQLRNYRNVIHPGVEIRKSFEPTQGKAQAALALLSLIVECLS